VLAAGLIIVSSSAAGFLVAGSYIQRVQLLRELIRFLQLLESEIQYARTTLPRLLAAQAPLFSGAVGRFLAALQRGLEAGSGDSFSAIWDRELAILADNGLPPAVLGDLRSWGAVLGSSDADEQSKQIKLLLARLEQAHTEAEQERAKNVRLWQYLGFCTGLLLVLLLI